MAEHSDSRHEISTAQRRVALTLAYLKVVRPGIDPSTRTKLADSILSLIDGKNPSVQRQLITDAQAVEIVWRHSQCVRNQTGQCPLLVFGRQMAEEINEFFQEGECEY